jgi:hypothetical protein
MPRFVLAAALVLASVTLVGARASRSIRLRLPPALAPAGRTEACVFVRIPGTTPFDLSGWQIRNHAPGLAVLHTIVYLYQGERLAEFATTAGKVVFSKGCLDFGPEDRDQRQMIAAITAPSQSAVLPPGVALRLMPVPATPGGSPDGFGFLIDVNWQNGGSQPRRGSARIILRRARRGSVRRLAQPLEDASAALGLDVAPETLRSTEDSTAALNAARPGDAPVRDAWVAPNDVCVLTIVPRMHKRSRFFGVDLLAADGTLANPPGGVSNLFEPGRTHLYAAIDYTDPGLRTFSPPLLLGAGEALHYLCWQDNGVTRALRLGCEESPGVPPGIADGLPGGGAAKSCVTPGAGSPDCPAADPAFPGRSFTGDCVPANLVGGTTADDETCALTGTFFEAAPGAGCDVSGLPVLE